MELSERKLRILQAIIGDFISTAEPVGSRALSKNIISESVLQQLGTKWLIWRRWGF